MNKIIKFAQLTVLSLFVSVANAGPMAFSVNSDSGNQDTEDSLYSIDLATGAHQRRGRLTVGTQTRLDTEGLAFAADGTLWGLDDEALTLFPINTDTGTIRVQDEVKLSGFSTLGGNDFGMSFACDNQLYVTSVITQTLYTLKLDGTSQVIGSVGALGQNISAIASIGNPVKIYGLGNGQLANGTTDSPNLFSIDPKTGVATLIGPLGAAAGAYNQGGLSFDAEGNLWAITDRRLIDNTIADLPSQILKIDLESGTATLISETTEVGFESLAIAAPSQCAIQPPPPPDISSEFPAIPSLSASGRNVTIFLLMLIGTIMLRRRAIH